MPSHTEGLPMVLIEACCFGVPILASNIGGIPELVKHRKNGLLFSAKSPKSIHEAILIFQREKDEIQSNASLNAKTSIERFSVNNWLIQHCEVYNSCFNQE